MSTQGNQGASIGPAQAEVQRRVAEQIGQQWLLITTLQLQVEALTKAVQGVISEHVKAQTELEATSSARVNELRIEMADVDNELKQLEDKLRSFSGEGVVLTLQTLPSIRAMIAEELAK